MPTANSLQKYSLPVITSAVGGRVRVGTIDGRPGFDPQYLGGFYTTPEYAALRTFIDVDGNTQLYPANYPDYRLTSERLLQSPPLSGPVTTQLVENYMRGQFDPNQPYAYFFANYNVWNAANVQAAVLPSPEIYLQNVSNAWGTGSTTAASFVDRGTFTFTADQGAYAVVGIAGPGADPSDPASVQFGFLLKSYKPVAVLESGVEYTLSSTTYIAGTTFAVRYINGAVNYLVNGTSLRQVTVTPPSLPVVFKGIACLYSANSNVVGVSVAGASSAAVSLPSLKMYRKAGIYSLPAMRGTAGWLPYAAVRLPAMRMYAGSPAFSLLDRRLPAITVSGGYRPPVTLHPLTMTGGQRSQARLAMRLIVKGSDYNYSAAAATLPKLTMTAFSGRPSFVGGIVQMPRMRAVLTGGTGQLGQGAVRLKAPIVRAGRAVSVASLQMPKSQVFGYQDPAGQAFISGVPLHTAAIDPQMVIVVSIDAGGTITSTTAVALVLDGQMASAATVAYAMSSTALLYALMNSALVGASFTPLSEQGAETWVINAETGGATSYKSYAFNSFGTVAGQLYGARSDGLYLMEGSTDAGQPIRASISFGASDFGTAQLKRMDSAYIGVSSGGTMYLRVKVRGGETYTYAARRSDDFLAQQRIDVGRGIRASVLTFELYNSGGCDFELNTVSFIAAELTRKV